MNLAPLADQVVTLLARRNTKLVLSESCTAGLIAASLGGVPGVSQYLCGSAVVYREQSKIDWLNVNPDTIRNHSAVSAETTHEIAAGVLSVTSEADWSLGITGHLGPNSPPELDGRVFVACCRRNESAVELLPVAVGRLQQQSRIDRQREAAEFALRHLILSLT